MTEKRTYILYDSRAADGMGTDNASVLLVCETESQALGMRGELGAMACYSCLDDGKSLTDERHEWNWFPGDPTTGPAIAKSPRKSRKGSRSEKSQTEGYFDLIRKGKV